MDRNRQSTVLSADHLDTGFSGGLSGVVSRNKVLRNTYALLALNLAFAAVVAGQSTVDDALAQAQSVVTREMTRAGYIK